MIAATILVPLVITGLIIGLVVWIFRRSSVGEDPAIGELRSRLARGEIDPIEFEVRLRALRGRGRHD
jgi:uncharacterized membrane protein